LTLSWLFMFPSPFHDFPARTPRPHTKGLKRARPPSPTQSSRAPPLPSPRSPNRHKCRLSTNRRPDGRSPSIYSTFVYAKPNTLSTCRCIGSIAVHCLTDEHHFVIMRATFFLHLHVSTTRTSDERMGPGPCRDSRHCRRTD